MLDHGEIESKGEHDKVLFQDIGNRTVKFLKTEISKYEILPEITFRTKELLSIIKKIKRKSKEKEYSYQDIGDKLGLRIICSFCSDLDLVDNVIKNNFHVIKAEYKKEELDFNKLDYTSNHYDVKIDANKVFSENPDAVKDLIFEIQVRSINQHAWSSSSHILTYKREAEIPKNLQRRVYRLLSLYEIADDEFSNVNKELTEQDNNMAYQFIRKLEGKIYKYAGVDFDRQESLSVIKTLLSDFKVDNQKEFLNQIEKFINTNNEKLEGIFSSNKSRYHKIPYLTQPEVFLVFYLMNRFPAKLEDIYANKLDDSELDQLKAIWA